MKLEVGKFYRTRDGRKAGPISWCPYFAQHTGPLPGQSYCAYWYPNGSRVDRTKGDGGDLVAEWVEPADERIVREELSDERVVEKFNELVKAGRIQLCPGGEWVGAHHKTEYRLKPAEPRCRVLPDSGLQTVLMEDGKTLEVGCSTITLTPALLSDFRALLKGKTHFGSGLKVMRHGVRYSDRGLLSWADADALLAFLEEGK